MHKNKSKLVKYLLNLGPFIQLWAEKREVCQFGGFKSYKQLRLLGLKVNRSSYESVTSHCSSTEVWSLTASNGRGPQSAWSPQSMRIESLVPFHFTPLFRRKLKDGRDKEDVHTRPTSRRSTSWTGRENKNEDSVMIWMLRVEKWWLPSSPTKHLYAVSVLLEEIQDNARENKIKKKHKEVKQNRAERVCVCVWGGKRERDVKKKVSCNDGCTWI